LDLDSLGVDTVADETPHADEPDDVLGDECAETVAPELIELGRYLAPDVGPGDLSHADHLCVETVLCLQDRAGGTTPRQNDHAAGCATSGRVSSDFFSICRIRSRVTPKCCPISSRVIGA